MFKILYQTVRKVLYHSEWSHLNRLNMSMSRCSSELYFIRLENGHSASTYKQISIPVTALTIIYQFFFLLIALYWSWFCVYVSVFVCACVWVCVCVCACVWVCLTFPLSLHQMFILPHHWHLKLVFLLKGDRTK